VQQAMGVAGRKPGDNLIRHKPKELQLVARVKAMPPGASFGDDHAIAFLPGAKRLRRNAEQLGHGADAVNGLV
jgi:hypothetical protein